MNLSKEQPKSTEPNWISDLPMYCRHCGGKMVRRAKKDPFYDSHSGRMKTEYYLDCEKITWWGRVFGSVHIQYWVVEEPDHFIGKYSYRGVFEMIMMP